jgi:hypothetical protein
MEESPKPKKPKKKSNDKVSSKANQSNVRTSLRALNKDTDTDAEMAPSPQLLAQSEYGSMADYVHEESWAEIIDKILTVDYADDGSHNVVYFLQL